MQAALLGGAIGSLSLAHALGFDARETLTLYGATQGAVYLLYLVVVLRAASVSVAGMMRAVGTPGSTLTATD
jgi:hypothetical protein